MCFSAECWADYRRYVREFGATVSIKDFAAMYGYERVRRRKTPKALDDTFALADSIEERQVAEEIQAIRHHERQAWQEELFKQRKRLADAQRVLAGPKPTKKATEDVRIAGNKVQQLLRWLADSERRERVPDDSRVFPGVYVPVMILENGRRVVKPMRYQCRLQGWTAAVERQYPGTYNARRDSLEKSWGKHWGTKHAVVVINSFYEHVWRHQAEGRALAPGEAEEDVVLQFKPRPQHDMILACLWSDWGGPGEELLSFAFITDEPPAEVAAAGHDRCVIPIKPENLDEWLRGGDLKRMHEILDDRDRPFYEHAIAA